MLWINWNQSVRMYCASHHGLWRKAGCVIVCDTGTCDRRCARYMYDSWCVTHVERCVCVSVCEELFCSIRRPAFHHILMIPHPAELSIFFFMSDISVHCPVNFPSKLYRYQVFVICPVKLIQYFLTYLDNTFMLKLW